MSSALQFALQPDMVEHTTTPSPLPPHTPFVILRTFELCPAPHSFRCARYAHGAPLAQTGIRLRRVSRACERAINPSYDRTRSSDGRKRTLVRRRTSSGVRGQNHQARKHYQATHYTTFSNGAPWRAAYTPPLKKEEERKKEKIPLPTWMASGRNCMAKTGEKNDAVPLRHAHAHTRMPRAGCRYLRTPAMSRGVCARVARHCLQRALSLLSRRRRAQQPAWENSFFIALPYLMHSPLAAARAAAYV